MIGEAVRLGRELDVPIVFVYVRRGPAGLFGAPVYQRRLTKEMARARRVLDCALVVAASAGVRADAEVLEGSPRRRITEFARDRDAVWSWSARGGAGSGRASRAGSSARPEDPWSSPKGFSAWPSLVRQRLALAGETP